MCMSLDPALIRGFGAVFALLCAASGVGAVLSRRAAGSAVVANLRTRVRAWWVIVIILAVAFSCGLVGSLTLFALLSVLALREYFTLVPTRRGDHRALFWMFFLSFSYSSSCSLVASFSSGPVFCSSEST